MKPFKWNEDKNEKLHSTRNITFEEVVSIINSKIDIEVYDHPNQIKYPEQKIYAINVEKYIYLIPFIEEDEYIFLKTIIPSRKATKKHRRGKE